MDTLTSFLMDQHGAEMSLDALTDSMLANLPHEMGTFDPTAPIVPFNSDFNKPTVSTVKQDFSQPQQPLWDFPILPQLAQAASPLDLAPQPVSRPLFTSYDQPQSADAGATAPAASQAPQPKKMQHTASSSSSDSKEDQEISKLQERIHKQKEKNARNQREFRRRAKERAMKIEEQVQQLTAKLSQTELEKQSLAAKNRVLEAALNSARATTTQSVGNNSSNFLAGPLLADDDMGDVMGPIVLTVRDGTPLQLTVDQFQRMTWHELMRIWKEYVNAIAMRLVTANNSFNGSSEQRLKELIGEVHQLMRGVALHNALLMHQHSMHRMDATPSSLQPQQPPPGFYANLMEMLCLSKEQKEQILAHRHVKLVSLARLVQERQELQARLQACNEATANPKEDLCIGAEFPQLLEVTEQLRDNVAQLHRSVCLFMGLTWKQVLSPVQAGTFMVQAFPWAPDMLALANVIAQEAKAPSIQDIFKDVLSSRSDVATQRFSL